MSRCSKSLPQDTFLVSFIDGFTLIGSDEKEATTLVRHVGKPFVCQRLGNESHKNWERSTRLQFLSVV